MEKRSPQLVIPHYVKLNFPYRSSLYLAPLWRPCLCGGRKNRSALFRLVSAIMKKRHQLKNGGSSQRLSQHSADNNYRLLSGDKRKSVEGERTRDGARSLARSPSPHYFTQIIFTPTSSQLQRIRNGFVLTLAVYAPAWRPGGPGPSVIQTFLVRLWARCDGRTGPAGATPPLK